MKNSKFDKKPDKKIVKLAIEDKKSKIANGFKIDKKK